MMFFFLTGIVKQSNLNASFDQRFIQAKKGFKVFVDLESKFLIWHTKIYVCLLIKSLPPKMNQTAKRNHNNKIKNNKELILQSWSFTIRFTDSDSG